MRSVSVKITLTLLLLWHAVSGWSQDFAIKRLEIAGDRINLYYDLVDTVASRSYTISLLSSHDNFVSPLQLVTGDIGLEVKPGTNRKIVWSAKEELGSSFDGKLSLEIRGRVYIPFVRLDGLNKVFRRLRPTQITWSGGTEQNILNFDLYKGDEKITSFPNLANVGHHALTIPITVKPGDGYRFRISDSKNKDQIVYSAPFKVVRNIPLALKAVPVILIGTAIIVAAAPGKAPPKEIPNPLLP